VRFWGVAPSPGVTAVRVRNLTVVAVAALAVAGLSGCNSKAGAAAVVDGHRITNSDVSKYLKPEAKPYAATDGSNVTINPKTYVLQTLIDDRLLDRAALAHGGPISEADMNAAKTAFLQGSAVSDVQKFYAKYGYTNSFATVLVHEQSLLQVLAQRVKATSSGNEIIGALDALKAKVSVSSRYGAWDKKTYAVSSGAKDGVPGFITLPAPSAVAPAATG
jgi:hypothetical protein